MSDIRSSGSPHLSLPVLGASLSTTFVITYVLCILYGLLGFSPAAHDSILPSILPGFTWITWPSFFLGLVWSFVYGWFVAVVLAPLFNFFSARMQ